MCAQWTTDSVTQHTQELLRQLGPVLVASGAGHSAGQLLLYLEELDLISDDTQLLQTLQAVAESQVSAPCQCGAGDARVLGRVICCMFC